MMIFSTCVYASTTFFQIIIELKCFKNITKLNVTIFEVGFYINSEITNKNKNKKNTSS